MTSLIWTPTIDLFRQTITDRRALRLIVSPFIKLDALKELMRACEDTSELQIIVRWQANDLLAGVSDLEIYPFLKEQGISLFRHPSIHLKLFVYDRSLAFMTSSNVTRRGLGLTTDANVEIGCNVQLGLGDWRQLFRVLAESEKIDDQMYAQASEYVAANKSTSIELPTMKLTPLRDNVFSKDSLPACHGPEELYSFYESVCRNLDNMEDAPEFIHDIVLYSIPDGLPRAEFFDFLARKFKEDPFIGALVEFIRSRGSAPFGAVNAWITEKCTDSPRPYRRDLKTTTRHLYNWLSFFYKEISWDTPNYSMVIYWSDKD